MLDPDTAELLARILAETRAGRLKWEKDDEWDYRAEIGTNATPISIRRMYIEATNQVGADPYFVQIFMHGWNGRFAITDDSDGWRAIREILDAGFGEGRWLPDTKQALAHMILKLGLKGET